MSGSIFPNGVFGDPHVDCEARANRSAEIIHELRRRERDLNERIKAARKLLRPLIGDAAEARRILDRRTR